MPALDQGTAEMLLNGMAGLSAYTATVLPLNLYVTMNAPTATVPGTQISGPGYTAGGKNITFGSLTPTPSGALLYNTNTVSWTNNGSSVWNCVGLEIWDSSGTPVRKAFALIDDQPIQIGPGSPLAFSASSLAWSFP